VADAAPQLLQDQNTLWHNACSSDWCAQSGRSLPGRAYRGNREVQQASLITRARLMPSLPKSKASLQKSSPMRLCTTPAVLRQLLSRLAHMTSARLLRRKGVLSLPSHLPTTRSKPTRPLTNEERDENKLVQTGVQSTAAASSVGGILMGSLTATETVL
jgi:hypothetical protein